MIDDAVSDEALLLAARTDAEAFTRFYRRHATPLLGYLVRRTRDPELGADLTAETFACALEGLARFDPDRGSAVNWLFGIARHQLLRTLQRGRVERHARDRLGMGRIDLDDDELERILALAESESTAALLADALEAVPPDQRAALDARVLDEQDYAAHPREPDWTSARTACAWTVARLPSIGRGASGTGAGRRSPRTATRSSRSGPPSARCRRPSSSTPQARTHVL